MKILEKSFKLIPLIARVIKEGGIVCSPTDTVYGLLGSVKLTFAVEKVYGVKKRDVQKKLIVLFDSVDSLKKYNFVLSQKLEAFLRKLWPKRVSVVLKIYPVSPIAKVFKDLEVAVRVPEDDFLRKLISVTGPLFAPSANPQGLPPAKNCKECERYFKDKVEICIKGKIFHRPSTIVKIFEKPVLVREGAVSFKEVVRLWKKIR